MNNPTRILGLDSMRFVCACFVLLGHFGIPFHIPIHDSPNLERLVNGFLNCLFNGPAAVIIFFIVSGFCIHFPYRMGSGPALGAFYIQRLVRIGLPATLAIFVWYFLGVPMKPPAFGVFWSIICEVIYYLIYPILLLPIARRIGWINSIIMAYLLGYALLFIHYNELQASDNSYTAMGLWTWIIGLPCWLMGCWLAENFQRFPSLTRLNMWLLRSFIFGVSVLLRILKFKSDSIFANNSIDLNLFALFACIWVGCEITYFLKRPPLKYLEWAGTWSYSLYVIHESTPAMFTVLFTFKFNHYLLPTLHIIFALVASYLFYCIIELPSHRLAKMLGKKLRRQAAAA